MAIVMAFVVLVPTLGCSGQAGQDPVVPQAGAGGSRGRENRKTRERTPKKATREQAETEQAEVEAAELEP